MSESIRLEIFSAQDSPGGRDFPDADQLQSLAARALQARNTLIDGTCAGSDFLGWLDLPSQAEEWVEEIQDLSLELVENVDHLVITGIGGSYLGAKALLQVFSSPGRFGGHVLLNESGKEPIGPEIHFAGEQLGSFDLFELIQRLKRQKFAVNVISKSGTTLETAIAFRLLRAELQQRLGPRTDKHIIATTDPHNGALRAMANRNGWRTFPIPPDVGGRFSVFSPVGLLPLAAAGLHIDALLAGARRAQKAFLRGSLDADAAGQVDVLLSNPALHYAALRHHFFEAGKQIEVLAGFEPVMTGIGSWWAQLFGECEGKQGKGLFPTCASYTTDLHSLGQYLQDGPRHMIETFISIDQPDPGPVIPKMDEDDDGLNSLAGRCLSDLNRAAELGTMTAHDAGGVPVMRIVMDELEESCLGELLYFFEASAAISALMLGVNPFDQPGVEAYKSEMRKQLES
ncbi:MAG: glucose-6-phosphate isomerase [bacterium]|nr:glucose-6-phosphate isomerase [bacterium]